MPESRIVRNDRAFLLEIDGKTMPMYGYMSYQPAKACYEDFKKIGVHLFFTGVYAGDRGINQQSGIRPFRPGFWKGYGEYDFSAVDEDFRLILGDSKPGENYVIPRLMIEPPSWWDKCNPGELSRDAEGTPMHQSYHSKKWLEDTREMFRAFQNWLEKSGWAAYVPGWHIACGNTEEFILPRLHNLQYTDYSAPAKAAFRAWLIRKYGTLENLNAAWHTDYHSFDDDLIPAPYQRIFAAYGSMRDLEREAQTIDFYRFTNESLAHTVCDLASLAKEATGGKQVIGAFFGYTCCDAEIGHHAADIVMNCEDIDFLASPFGYIQNRAQGMDWPFHGPVESAALHGKPWFMEADVRTCYSEPLSKCMTFADPVVSRAYDSPVWSGPKDIEGSLGQMGKAFARVLTHNTAVWWFDMWGGWYHQDQLMAFHKKAFEIYKEHVFAGGSENAAPIALLEDDETFLEINTESFYSSRLATETWVKLGPVGTPYRMFLMDDFDQLDPASYRVALFASAHHFTEKQLKALENWKKDGRVLIFLGPVDSSIASGVKVKSWPEAEEHPLEKELTSKKMRLEALPGDVIFDRAPDGESVSLLRRFRDYSVFVSTAILPDTAFIRRLTAGAAGRVYSYDNDVVYASEKFVAVHAASNGIKRINVNRKVRFVNAFTGEILPANECYADVKMAFGETLLLRLEDLA
ncbi:MAG: beta-galactosidase [Clostridia bacterium]|nr:beta-galactosidase [Clostridia bacterium]